MSATIIINGCTAAEWCEDARLANEFLTQRAKLRGDGLTLDLRRGTTEAEMHASLTPRQKALVALAEQAGGAVRELNLSVEVPT